MAGIGSAIPTTCNERPQRTLDRDRELSRELYRELYRERNRVERCINRLRLKQFRRVATRYETLAVNFLAMVTIAAILIWL
jgi:transposase